MQLWRFWWQTLVLSSQYDPPQFVELIMLLLAVILFGCWWAIGNWPYLILSLSYIVGSSASLLVRESLLPSRQFHILHAIASFSLIFGLGFIVLESASYL